jgi:hypothetical protein
MTKENTMSGTKCEVCGEVDCGGGGIEYTNDPSWPSPKKLAEAALTENVPLRPFENSPPMTKEQLLKLCEE